MATINQQLNLKSQTIPSQASDKQMRDARYEIRDTNGLTNKPNFKIGKMNATFLNTKLYANEPRTMDTEHASKQTQTNPIQTQSNPKQTQLPEHAKMNLKPYLKNDYGKSSPFGPEKTNPNKPNSPDYPRVNVTFFFTKDYGNSQLSTDNSM